MNIKENTVECKSSTEAFPVWNILSQVLRDNQIRERGEKNSKQK